MSAEFVYRCTDPAIAADINAYPDERKAYFHAFEALSAEWFPGEGRGVLVATGSFGGERFAGFESKPGDLPKGWRTGKHGTVVPHKGTKEGKAFAAAIAAVEVPVEPTRRLIGMPTFHMNGARWYSPGMRFAGGEMYVTWGVEPHDVDLEKWEPVKLSAYYAAIEADDERGDRS